MHESVPAADCQGFIYVENVRRLATNQGFPVVIITYTAPDIVRNGWKPHSQQRPEEALYMHKAHSKNVRPYLFYIPPLTDEIIVPYTMRGVNRRLDAIPNFKERVPDDVRETIGEFLGTVTARRKLLADN